MSNYYGRRARVAFPKRHLMSAEQLQKVLNHPEYLAGRDNSEYLAFQNAQAVMSVTAHFESLQGIDSAPPRNLFDASFHAHIHGWTLPRQMKNWCKKLSLCLFNRSNVIAMMDNERHWRFAVHDNRVLIFATVKNSVFTYWDDEIAHAISAPFPYTEKEFIKTIKGMRAKLRELDVTVKAQRTPPPDFNQWMEEKGCVLEDVKHQDVQYFTDEYRRYRVNFYGKLDISCKHDNFDRWANSVAESIDIPKTRKEFFDVFENVKTVIEITENGGPADLVNVR